MLARVTVTGQLLGSGIQVLFGVADAFRERCRWVGQPPAIFVARAVYGAVFNRGHPLWLADLVVVERLAATLLQELPEPVAGDIFAGIANLRPKLLAGFVATEQVSD